MDFKVALVFIVAHLVIYGQCEDSAPDHAPTKKQRIFNLLLLALSVALLLQGIYLIRSSYDFWAHLGIGNTWGGGGRSMGQAFLLSYGFPYMMVAGYGFSLILSLLREVSFMLSKKLDRLNKKLDKKD
jgi:hypothetical protein